jgi:hypothetical protein
LRKNRQSCHPEEAKPVLSETKEGSLYLLENSNTGVLRFAQDDSIGAFFRSLYSAFDPRNSYAEPAGMSWRAVRLGAVEFED